MLFLPQPFGRDHSHNFKSHWLNMLPSSKLTERTRYSCGSDKTSSRQVSDESPSRTRASRSGISASSCPSIPRKTPSISSARPFETRLLRAGWFTRKGGWNVGAKRVDMVLRLARSLLDGSAIASNFTTRASRSVLVSYWSTLDTVFCKAMRYPLNAHRKELAAEGARERTTYTPRVPHLLRFYVVHTF
jgi:hypothetical protein